MLTHTSLPCSHTPPSTHPWPPYTAIQPYAHPHLTISRLTHTTSPPSCSHIHSQSPHSSPCSHTSSQFTHTTHHAVVPPSHALTKFTQLTKLPLWTHTLSVATNILYNSMFLTSSIDIYREIGLRFRLRFRVSLKFKIYTWKENCVLAWAIVHNEIV